MRGGGGGGVGGGGGGGAGIPIFVFPGGGSRRIPLKFRQIPGGAPLKWKLLYSWSGLTAFALLLFIIISLLLVFPDRWHRPSRSPASLLAPPGRKGYTVIINTWKRNDLLKQCVAHYASCGGVESIRVVWSEPEPPSDSLRDSLRESAQRRRGCGGGGGGGGVELRIDVNEEDSLNNRFKEVDGLSTDAVFSVDDDVVFPCASMDLAFDAWRSAPESMVGFVPRMHWAEPRPGGMNYYKYGGWWSVWWEGTYSMVLSKAAFFHKKYLRLYTARMPAFIRDYVTKYRNCEDIAMSFLVANETGAPPIWVKGRIFEIGSSGISSLGGHSDRRTHCLNSFALVYGNMPLVATNTKVIDGRSSWMW